MDTFFVTLIRQFGFSLSENWVDVYTRGFCKLPDTLLSRMIHGDPVAYHLLLLPHSLRKVQSMLFTPSPGVRWK
jgi:hypothetical protein